MTPEREAACRRIIEDRFQAGEYDFVGRDLLAALDAERAAHAKTRKKLDEANKRIDDLNHTLDSYSGFDDD